MDLEFLVSGGRYYMRRPGNPTVWCWQQEEDRWTARRQRLEPGAEAVDMAKLPAELREEVLAFAARAQAMGPQAWGAN